MTSEAGGAGAASAATPKPAVGILILLWLASTLGLFFLPLDLYDEPALLTGSRIVRAGGLPYADFYTHYGPLGYHLIAPFLILDNVGIAYRSAQAVALAACAALILLVARRFRLSSPGAAALIGFGFLNFTAALVYTHFPAFALVLGGLASAALAASRARPRQSDLLWALAGACAALAGLVRPAFAAYVSGAVAALALATYPPRAAGLLLLRFAVGGAGAAAVTWLILYVRLPVSEAWFGAVVLPYRLAGGPARFLPPSPLPASFSAASQTAFAAIHLAALYVLATLSGAASPRRAARGAAIIGAAVALAAPLTLRAASHPGRIVPLLVIVMFLAAAASVALAHRDSDPSSISRASALCGLAGVAFFHYYLARGDQAHLTASLALAASAALLQWTRLTRAWRTGASALLALAVAPLFAGAIPYPARWIGHPSRPGMVSTTRGFWGRLPAAAFPGEAVAAVEHADRISDPSSRFVAAASDHSRTEGSAAILFAISRRLPYTRWYAYDPNVQSSELVQRMMAGELERSRSRAAVVWSASSFAGREPSAGEPPATLLDRAFARLYPEVLVRYGGLTVRERAGDARR